MAEERVENKNCDPLSSYKKTVTYKCYCKGTAQVKCEMCNARIQPKRENWNKIQMVVITYLGTCEGLELEGKKYDCGHEVGPGTVDEQDVGRRTKWKK